MCARPALVAARVVVVIFVVIPVDTASPVPLANPGHGRCGNVRDFVVRGRVAMKDSARPGHDAPVHERRTGRARSRKHRDHTRTRHSSFGMPYRPAARGHVPASDPPAAGGVTRYA
ncbi:hypothetical protein CFB50_37725 [Burkholderia sp. AU33423]|nr:hypothetical protein CFB50_37725 [Burkholderia sp. AU33423]